MRSWIVLCLAISLLACEGDEGPEQRADGGPDPVDAAEPDSAEPDSAEPDSAEPDAEEPDASSQPDGDGAGDEPCTSCGACVESQAVTSTQHVAGGIDYADLPPFGGSHDPCWTRFGVHAAEVADEHWVHNLEHGAVVFLYHCPDGCDDEIAALELLAAPRPFVLVMPYAELPTRFAAVAWGRRLLSECFDEAAFEEFYDRYSAMAPESSTSPPPSGC